MEKQKNVKNSKINSGKEPQFDQFSSRKCKIELWEKLLVIDKRLNQFQDELERSKDSECDTDSIVEKTVGKSSIREGVRTLTAAATSQSSTPTNS